MTKEEARARLGVRPAVEGFEVHRPADTMVLAAVLVAILAIAASDRLGLHWFAPW